MENLFTLVRTAFQYGSLPLTLFMVYKCLEVIAGKTTSFNVVANSVVDWRANEWIAWILSGVFGVAWKRERSLRFDTIRQQANHIRELETTIDRKRKSSGLTSTGQPRKEDQDAT